MKKLSVLTIMLFSVLLLKAQSPIEGVWNTGQANTKVEILGESEVYEGKIVSSDNPQAPIGKVLIKDIQLVDGKWKGKLFAVKRNAWMDAVLKEKGNQLLVTVKAGSMGKTIKWKKE